MDDEELVPDAELMESMRAFGYSLKTAIADICDNSVAAQASKIDVSWSISGEPYVTILDDGLGMTRDELRTAMKPAGRSPLVAREQRDLGRFGLGMKTASLSQGRTLTVVSKGPDGSRHAAQWDLDYLRKIKKWNIRWLEDSDLATIPHIESLEAQATGTLVVWQNLDLLFQGSPPSATDLSHEFEEVSSHLGLVFHRFTGKLKDKLSIRVNAISVPIYDPFLENESGTVDKGTLTITIDGSEVIVHPYILPPISKMTTAQRDKAIFDKKHMRDAQGFYVYRNERLLTWGTWFRTAPLMDATKLARVRVDMDKSLDAKWQLGVMKSSVKPPRELMIALKQLVPQLTEQSQRAAQGKSAVVGDTGDHLWLIKELSDTSFQLQINRDYPLIQALGQNLESADSRIFSSILRYLEATFPSMAIHHRLARDNSHKDGFAEDSEIWEQAVNLKDVLQATLSISDEDAWKLVDSTPPFLNDLQLRSKLQRLKKAQEI
jgi:hypothetical protein